MAVNTTIEHLETGAVLGRRVEQEWLHQGDPGGQPRPDALPLAMGNLQYLKNVMVFISRIH